MLAIIALVLAIVALTVLSFAVHVLFSPLLLLLVAAGLLAWIKFRPRRARQWPESEGVSVSRRRRR